MNALKNQTKGIMRLALTGLFAIIFLGAGQAAVFAQETDQETKKPVEQTQDNQATQSPEVVTEPNIKPAPEFEIQNAALKQALAAREIADRAMLDAVEKGDGKLFETAVAARNEADQAIVDVSVNQSKLNAKLSPPGTAQTPKKKSKTPFNADGAKELLKRVWDKLFSWLTSAAFLAMIGVIFAAYFLSPLLARSVKKRVPLLRTPPAKDAKLRLVRHYLYEGSHLLRPVFLVGLLAVGALILKNIQPLGQDWLVKLAQGLAVVFLLFKAIKQFIKNPLFQKITIWVAIPLALLMVFGYYDDLLKFLNGTTVMQMGDTPITLMTFVRLAIFGGLFFWLGGISNNKGQSAIRSQETLDVATREVVAKMFQIFLFIILFVLILSFAGIPLSGLVMIFSAVGLGIGFGLQPIAANFISGLIILFDRSVKVGDYIVLPDGQEGYVEAINMRSATVETTDGKDIMVPNVKFIDEAYENWTHKDPRQRYEVYFSVAYGTDLNKLEDILIPEISKHPKVLQEPEEPDLELREFGDFGIKFAIEFWCDGIDDGENKFTSDLNFIVWRTLKKHKIEMPLPQREIRILKD